MVDGLACPVCQGGADRDGDLPLSGRPPLVIDAAKSSQIAATLRPPPVELGVTHESSRLLAARVGMDHFTVADLGRLRSLPKPVGDVKVLHRPAAGGQGL